MGNSFERKMSAEDERTVAAFMARLAAIPGTDEDCIPDPAAVWWKAQLLRRWDAERRAQVPLDVMESIEIVVGLAAAVFLLVWSLPLLLNVLELAPLAFGLCHGGSSVWARPTKGVLLPTKGR